MGRQHAFFGIDIGGSKTEMALYLSSKDKIVLISDIAKIQTSRNFEHGVENINTELEKIVNDFPKDRLRQIEIAGIGIGAPGVIYDPANHVYVLGDVANLPNWSKKDLNGTIGRKFGATYLESDVNASAMGYHLLHDFKLPLFFLNMGTGIGVGCLYSNGKIIRKENENPLEFGHLEAIGMSSALTTGDCRHCPYECIESYLGKNALLHRFDIDINHATIRDIQFVSTNLAAAIRQLELILKKEYNTQMRSGLIGGGVAKALGMRLIDSVRQNSKIEIHQAFDHQAPTLGAAALAYRELDTHRSHRYHPPKIRKK